ncbi:M56 family metallopeptidase [Gulosibacter chungangensis]|uniref:M56 family metallopeptidase n=1 Tax=Gulosibacter chungangensis TaxID=979746 RepID=A0A7J5BAH9_9MICO|nr:M56 family metallopeptidase [Gulosibacter chungangensis]KAB1641883.1 M56 family metallopeptidase [Gulosibacter chungangensis]
MLPLSIGLAALAVTLAWPVPIALSRAEWTTRSPAITLVLWQTIALAGGFSMLSSLLLFGLAPFGDSLAPAITNFLGRTFDGSLWVGDFPHGFGFPHAGALCLAALLFAHLILNLITTTTRTIRQHRRHRQLIELLSTPVPGQYNTRQIAADAPFAYCLPGLMTDMTVVSEGLVRQLTDEQLDAVIAHERAHLEQRHTVVLTVFAAWANALPWFPIANRAQQSIALLIEMLADDLALRHVSRQALIEAVQVVALGQQTSPGAALHGEVNTRAVRTAQHTGSAPESWLRRMVKLLWAAPPIENPVGRRVERLLAAPQPLEVGPRVLVLGGSVLLLAVPPLTIF